MLHRIVQISDPHLTDSSQGRVRDVPTWKTFGRVLERIADDFEDFEQVDRLVITGDIAQDEQPRTYAMLAQALGDLVPRTRAIPGNHDDPLALAAVFEPRGLLDGGFVDEVGGWRLIGLNSHVQGRTDGAVGWRQRCAWSVAMRHEPAVPTLVFVHHPPVSVGTSWLDPIGLQDAAAVLETCRTNPAVQAVFHGHTHQASEHRSGATPVYGSPSTAFQFAPGTPDVELEDRPPGYRWIELDGGAFRTGVVRLEG